MSEPESQYCDSNIEVENALDVGTINEIVSMLWDQSKMHFLSFSQNYMYYFIGMVQ